MRKEKNARSFPEFFIYRLFVIWRNVNRSQHFKISRTFNVASHYLILPDIFSVFLSMAALSQTMVESPFFIPLALLLLVCIPTFDDE